MVQPEPEMRNKSGSESSLYTGVDLAWRTTPPPTTFSNGRKRTWDARATTPVQELANGGAWSNNGSSELSVTPEFGAPTGFSSNATSVTLAGDDDVEEIPRTKMQTGCIPCL